MGITKRTYQKHKKEYKLSIKHYSNSDVKEFDDKGVTIYPIYVEVTFKRKTTRFRSKLPSIYSELQKREEKTIDWTTFDYDDPNNLRFLEVDSLEEALNRDYHLIESIVNYQISIKEDKFSIVDLPRLYHTSYHKLSFFVDWCLKKELQDALCNINEINDFGLENTSQGRDTLFPIVNETSSLNNLEYYLRRYPELLSLKEKYNSQTWIFDFYLGIMVRPELFDSYWLIGSFQNSYADFGIEITVLDFQEKYFQAVFLNCFQHEEFAKDILSDIEILFSKYFDRFNKEFMV